MDNKRRCANKSHRSIGLFGAIAIGVFVFFMLVSILFELFYGKLVRKHIFHRPYD